MNKVEPIRNQKKIEEIKAYLKNWNEKYYMMWLLGSNIGLRVSDIMKIKDDDIVGKDHLLFRDKKTNKEHRLPVNRHLRREIADNTPFQPNLSCCEIPPESLSACIF